MISLEGKNIVITGASSGIGRNCAILCTELGANVIILGRNSMKLQQTFDALSGKNNMKFIQDVTEFEKLESIINQAVTNLGYINGFLHCAGFEMTVPLQNMNVEKYNRLFLVNTISAFELARIISKKKYCSPLGGSFIFISSVMGHLGAIGKVGYCSSKSSLISGSKAMALELASKKIRVNCILPGIVETEMVQKMMAELPVEALEEIRRKHPLGFGKPEDISHLCGFLLSDHANWITGSDLIIDGGYSCQ
jgi:NAD(P)-dependent dehydrogenase (short-subunit alcohol dehydrogenase family)